MKGSSLEITQELINKLRNLLPSVFSEDEIDFDKLRTVLGEHLHTGNERYQLSWAGKSDAYKALQNPENLEVLKILQKAYYGKVKMIYIDPPYNTGKDSFIYPDKFSETKEEYLKRTGDKDDDGYMTREGMFRTNSKENGQYHSNWLNMMLPRLFLAKNLLEDSGVIFVSIDNHEQANLKLVLDEIFGEENFIECLTWNKRIPKNDKGIGNIHEYILIYAKNTDHKHQFLMRKEGLSDIYKLLKKLKTKKAQLPYAEKEIKKLFKKKDYDRGITLYNSLDDNYCLWGKINMSWPNANTFGPTYEIKHPKTNKAVNVPDRGWRWKLDTFREAAKYENGKYTSIKELHDGSFMCGRIWFGKDENVQPSSITYLEDVESFLLRSILSLKSDGGIEVEKLFDGKSYFSYPKPTSLLKTLFSSFDLGDNDIVLDFFSGSASTAHAIFDLNESDEIKRKFICVQLDEETKEDSVAFSSGFKTVSEVAEERIKRVITKIDSSRSKELPFTNVSDLGFRKFSLQDSNFKIWRGDKIKSEVDLKEQVELFNKPQREGAEVENMLWELLIKSGVPLTEKIAKIKVGNASIYHTENKQYAFVLEKYNEGIQNEVLQLQPKVLVSLDSLFEGNDNVKTNAQLKFEDNGISFKTV
jgi:adenine-specific DNA-methyltransferase